jgi:hypothetical protein
VKANGQRRWGSVPAPSAVRSEPARAPVPWETVLERLREATVPGALTGKTIGRNARPRL